MLALIVFGFFFWFVVRRSIFGRWGLVVALALGGQAVRGQAVSEMIETDVRATFGNASYFSGGKSYGYYAFVAGSSPDQHGTWYSSFAVRVLSDSSCSAWVRLYCLDDNVFVGGPVLQRFHLYRTGTFVKVVASPPIGTTCYFNATATQTGNVFFTPYGSPSPSAPPLPMGLQSSVPNFYFGFNGRFESLPLVEGEEGAPVEEDDVPDAIDPDWDAAAAVGDDLPSKVWGVEAFQLESGSAVGGPSGAVVRLLNQFVRPVVAPNAEDPGFEEGDDEPGFGDPRVLLAGKEVLVWAEVFDEVDDFKDATEIARTLLKLVTGVGFLAWLGLALWRLALAAIGLKDLPGPEGV